MINEGKPRNCDPKKCTKKVVDKPYPSVNKKRKKKMNSRLRLLAIERLFINKKQLTMKEIKTELKNVYGIESERKAIYKDIEALKNFFFFKKKKVNNTTIYVLEKSK